MKNSFFYCLMVAVLVSGCSSSSRRGDEQNNQYVKASEAYRAGNLSTAEVRYRELVGKHPDFVDGWFKLGNIYVRTAQYEAAVVAYRRALKLAPEDARIWNNLALSYIKMSVAVLEEGDQHVLANSSGQASMRALKGKIVDSVISVK